MEEGQAFDDFSLVSSTTSSFWAKFRMFPSSHGLGLEGAGRSNPKRPVAELPLIQIFNPEIGYKTRVPFTTLQLA